MHSNKSSRRGSEWRKWDMHVHSPKTFLSNYYGNIEIDEFVNKVSESGVAAIGLTNYFRFDDSELGEIKSKLEERGIVVFPNLEFRTSQTNKHNVEFNFHILFSDKILPEKIKDFLGRLETIDENYCKNLTEHQIKNTTIDFGILRDTLKNDKSIRHLEDYLIIGCPRGHGQFRPGNNSPDGRGHNSATEFDKFSDIFFGNLKDVDYFLNKNRHEGAIKKPVLLCSDAHKLDDIGNEFTWIKADPTFEGLKQILYEPTERVKIQKDNPSFEFDKPYFINIEIKDEFPIFEQSDNQVYFCKRTLPLNKNLVAIIGGRGSGKSKFIDYWANIFTDNSPNYTKNDNYIVQYAKDNSSSAPAIEKYNGSANNNHLDFIYISQNALEKISDKTKIDKEIKSLLGLTDLRFSEDLDSEIQKVQKEINDIQEWFDKKNEAGQQNNKKDYVKSVLEENTALLKSITTERNKEKLENYTTNIGEIRDIETTIRSLKALTDTISATQEMINEDIEKIIHSTSFKKYKCENIILTNFEEQQNFIAKNKIILEIQKSKKETENSKIENDFKEEGFSGDLSSLLSKADTLKSNIQWATQQFESIKETENELTKEWQKRDDLSEKLKAEYERQKDAINNAWDTFFNKDDKEHTSLIKKILLQEGKISIEGEIIFNKKIFYEKVLKRADNRRYRDIDALEKQLKISTFEDWVKFINEKLKDFINNEDPKKINGLEEIIFNITERKNYLNAVPKVTYENKKLEHLSVGQRGTVYLCLRLATDAFSTPIIFDQPEDDLDNKFITTKLVSIFRELKQYRQIIIVTHNANLVVNADAEQVIIANNDSEKLSYESGSLENPKIIESVCEVLEGGREAFEQRKRKYQKHI